MKSRALGEHPTGEDAPDLAVQCNFVDFDEGVRLGLFGIRTGIANTRRHLKRAELHGFVDIDVERGDAAGDLVEPGEFRDRVGDANVLAFHRGRLVVVRIGIPLRILQLFQCFLVRRVEFILSEGMHSADAEQPGQK